MNVLSEILKLENPILLSALLIAAVFAVYFADRVGVINIGVEGQILFGVFGYTLSGYFTKNLFSQLNNPELENILRFILLILGAWVGVLFATGLFALFTIKLRMDQVLIGITLNIILAALATFLVYVFHPLGFFKENQGRGIYLNLNWECWLLLVLLLISLIPLVYLFFQKTKPGLRIKATKESSKVVNLAGINETFYQYLALFLGTFFATLAAVFYAQRFSTFKGAIYGYGYLGLAILILSKEKIPLIFFFSILFASLYSLALNFNPNSSANTNNKSFLNKLLQERESLKEVIYSFNYILPLTTMIVYGAYDRYRFNSSKKKKKKLKEQKNPSAQVRLQSKK